MTSDEKAVEEFRSNFIGCNYKDCAGPVCSKHQFREEVAGKIPALFEAFILKTRQEAREEVEVEPWLISAAGKAEIVMETIKEERQRILDLPCMQNELMEGTKHECCEISERNRLRREIRDALQSK